jgi:hypothetical protein
MRTLIWIATATLLVLWSGLSWLAHSLVSVGGNLVATNADIIPADPLLIEWASWLATAGTGVGEWLVVALWAVVSLVIVALGFIAARLSPRLKSVFQHR